MTRLAGDALFLCEGFGSSAFRTSGGETGRGLLDDEEVPYDAYGAPGQTAKQRRREFRVTTKQVSDYTIVKQDSLWITDAVTDEEVEYTVGDIRKETDGAVSVLYLKAA